MTADDRCQHILEDGMETDKWKLELAKVGANIKQAGSYHRALRSRGH